jgi:polyhydroxyalkanoate synthesis regulator phasin
MKKISEASQKSNKKRLEALKAKAAEVDALKARIEELEQRIGGSE